MLSGDGVAGARSGWTGVRAKRTSKTPVKSGHKEAVDIQYTAVRAAKQMGATVLVVEKIG